MGFQTRVVNPPDVRVVFEVAGNGQGVTILPFDSDSERLQAPFQEVTGDGVQAAAEVNRR